MHMLKQCWGDKAKTNEMARTCDENGTVHPIQGRIQDFKLGGGALKKIVPSEGRREKFWGISCEKTRF